MRVSVVLYDVSCVLSMIFMCARMCRYLSVYGYDSFWVYSIVMYDFGVGMSYRLLCDGLGHVSLGTV